MKKYCVDISLKDDSKKYSIIGYEGQKKSDVNEHLGFFLKDRQLELGKNNSITDFKGNTKGFYEFYSM